MNDTLHTPSAKLRSWADGLDDVNQGARAKSLRSLADDVDTQVANLERKLLEPIAELLAEMGRGGHSIPGPAVEPETFSVIAALKRQATLGPALRELLQGMSELSSFYGEELDHGQPNPKRILDLARRHGSALSAENDKLRDQVIKTSGQLADLLEERNKFANYVQQVIDAAEVTGIARLCERAVAEVGQNP